MQESKKNSGRKEREHEREKSSSAMELAIELPEERESLYHRFD